MVRPHCSSMETSPIDNTFMPCKVEGRREEIKKNGLTLSLSFYLYGAAVVTTSTAKEPSGWTLADSVEDLAASATVSAVGDSSASSVTKPRAQTPGDSVSSTASSRLTRKSTLGRGRVGAGELEAAPLGWRDSGGGQTARHGQNGWCQAELGWWERSRRGAHPWGSCCLRHRVTRPR
jgi:hypothetical protein